VLEKYPKEVKLVIKQFPLPMHGYAKKAAMAALAAERQGKFWEVHEKLFSSQRELNDSKVEELVRDLGLNIDQFNSDLKDPALGLLIDRDIINGRQANVKGTPTIFVNRKLLSTRSLQGFQLAIEAELKKKK
jgi:protein-disulfide isomerase